MTFHASGVVAPFGLSYQQQAAWTLCQLRPHDTSLHLPCVFRVGPAAEWRRVADALCAVLDRLPVLRCVFCDDGGRLTQAVTPSRAVTCCDLRDADAQTVTRCVEAEVFRPFELNTDAVRILAFRLDADRAIVAWVVHHIVADAWTLEHALTIFLQTLGLDAGATARSSTSIDDYRDFVDWQEAWLRGLQASRSLAFWDAHLGRERLERLRRPQDVRAGMPSSIPSVQRITSRLESEAPSAARGLRPDVPTMIAALQVSMADATGADRAPIGVETSGRIGHRFRSVAGLFANPIVLSNPVRLDRAFSAQIARTASALRLALRHSRYPFARLVRELRPASRRGDGALFQVSFNYYRSDCLPGFAGIATGLGGTLSRTNMSSIDVLPIASHHAHSDLAVTVFDDPTSVAILWEWRPAAVDDEVARQMYRVFTLMLREASMGRDVVPSAVVRDARVLV